ncbi:paxillin [Capsaspora owczarzaki ATCC 30864]|uniref:Paxillin n=1 Tax=Capsaspora owczarzaki (strain ATCC 30864) TaxID=595528 RepID=A0A0D2WU78_CAPO3|nr:paxillin [Capsaspora owczarzaki ATCC 30864]KJE96140.1 paxillin [Capsaspora owczarzaki ATCC 30864]|eukprot:XP_004345254.1 paxillin [Capsaspora owczarzaki ATCC 30864]
MDELDALLKDLQGGKPVDGAAAPAPAAAAAEPAAAVNPAIAGLQQKDSRSSVDDLLADLQSFKPQIKKIESTSAPAPQRASVDELLADLQSTGTLRNSVVRSTPSAADATRPKSGVADLDSVMASLQDFKVEGASRPASMMPAAGGAPAAGGSGKLDSILNSLQSEMTSMGVDTARKGDCAACGKGIVGQVVTALGRTWHVEHFVCFQCRKPLGTTNFFEHESNPYCEKDFHELFSQRCAYCNGPVLDRCIHALGKTWHPDHFFCSQCGKNFEGGGFMERDGKAYCEEDYFNMFAPKCGGCDKAIMADCISALGYQWHPNCFVCAECKKGFNGGSFFEHEGKPFCETHYHAQSGSLCSSCQKPITGRCVTALNKKYHPEHFVCSFCMKQLQKGTFKDENGKPYCHQCHVKLFG